MTNIIFIGPPASGKGTQSKMLAKKYNYKHISTGDLLRNSNDPKIKETIAKGNFVSDEIVENLIKETLQTNQGPFVFDGYPRNINQAYTLKNILDELGMQIEHVIYLDIPLEEASKRSAGRQSCPKCNRIYHKYNKEMKPLKENICDDCNIPLKVREDDTEEAYKIRYETFMKDTMPILKYYEKENLLRKIHNQKTADETLKQIEEIIYDKDTRRNN